MLGFTVKDIITGFTGVVTAKTVWLNGCIRYGVQSRELKDGIPLKSLQNIVRSASIGVAARFFTTMRNIT